MYLNENPRRDAIRLVTAEQALHGRYVLVKVGKKKYVTAEFGR
ncbi:hypothetical protein [Paenibacillus methanolicus]|nr:hypothetical protein [Paenibacillus methanolicus]